MSRPIGAAIDLGSTSVHLLVARPEPGGLVAIEDESTFLGLGAAVDGPGVLGPAGRATLVDTVGRYVARARELGASRPIVMGTEPLRRLGDAAQIEAEISAATGVTLVVLEHEEEALLTLVGLMAGSPVSTDLLIADIGGGSTELVEIGPGRPPRAIGVKVGAAGLTRRVVDSNPPTRTHLKDLGRVADGALAWQPSRRPADVVFVGGTASNLLKLLRGLGSPERHDRLDRVALDRVREILVGAPSERLAADYGLRDARVRLLAAGAAIVETVLDRAGVSDGRVVDTGVREGAIVAVDRVGEGWRERLEDLARGPAEDQPPTTPEVAAEAEARFRRSGGEPSAGPAVPR